MAIGSRIVDWEIIESKPVRRLTVGSVAHNFWKQELTAALWNSNECIGGANAGNAY